MDTQQYVDALVKGDAPDAIVPLIVAEVRHDIELARLRRYDRERFHSNIPLSNADGTMTLATINVPYEMTESEWKQLHLTLAAWKPALVTEAEK